MQANEDIVTAIKSGCVELVPELLRNNKGVIYKVAHQYKTLAERNRGADMDDLMQATAYNNCLLNSLKAVMLVVFLCQYIDKSEEPLHSQY